MSIVSRISRREIFMPIDFMRLSIGVCYLNLVGAVFLKSARKLNFNSLDRYYFS